MTYDETLVWEILHEHIGRFHAISSRDLEQATGFNGVKIRKVVNSLVVNSGQLVGSSHYGYFLIDTPEDFKLAINNLEHRKIELEKRIQALEVTHTKGCV